MLQFIISGCNKFTIQDMWRMIWQLESTCIIMVTNLVENTKVSSQPHVCVHVSLKSFQKSVRYRSE